MNCETGQSAAKVISGSVIESIQNEFDAVRDTTRCAGFEARLLRQKLLAVTIHIVVDAELPRRQSQFNFTTAAVVCASPLPTFGLWVSL